MRRFWSRNLSCSHGSSAGYCRCRYTCANVQNIFYRVMSSWGDFLTSGIILSFHLLVPTLHIKWSICQLPAYHILLAKPIFILWEALHSTMRLTTLKTSMPSLSSVGAQRPAINQHIGASRRHSMSIKAAAASDATEVWPIPSFRRFFFAMSQHESISKGFPYLINHQSELCDHQHTFWDTINQETRHPFFFSLNWHCILN